MLTEDELKAPLITDLMDCDKKQLYEVFHFLLKGKKVYRIGGHFPLSRHIPFWAVKCNRKALVDIVNNKSDKFEIR